MTPAWVCFDHEPSEIAENAYAGLLHEGERIFRPGALKSGGFEVIVSGHRKGTGSSRETAPQCERWSVYVLLLPLHSPQYTKETT